MVQLTYRASPEACNWALDDHAPLCERCNAVVGTLVSEAAEQFDLRDPVSVPHFPRSALRAGQSARN